MAVGDAYVFPGFLTPVLTLLFFQSHRLLFSHASADVRGENTPEILINNELLIFIQVHGLPLKSNVHRHIFSENDGLTNYFPVIGFFLQNSLLCKLIFIQVLGLPLKSNVHIYIFSENDGLTSRVRFLSFFFLQISLLRR